MVGVLHPVGIVFLPCLGTPKKKKKSVDCSGAGSGGVGVDSG